MQPYQEEYISNLKDIAVFTARKKSGGKSFEEYLAEILKDRKLAEQKVKRNMELLREGLFPVLDHLFEADEETLRELQEFAGQLSSNTQELDVMLFCQIHQALLSLARLKKDRSRMIEELYWLGMGRYRLCNTMVGLELSETEGYMSQMRLCFAEAAAYLKYYDEIENTETRGYILRSRANISLGQFKSPGEKIRLVKQTLEILQDETYREKEPKLPWDRFVYMTHQQMTSSISRGRESVMTPQDIADVMESVYIVYQRRLQEAKEKRQQPSCRWIFSYDTINFYCGLDTLDGLLTKMEALMDSADTTDFSPDSMYGLISMPAFYCQYLSDYPERILEREEYIETLYQRILDYLAVFPGAAGNESLFFYLRQLSSAFLETRGSITYGDFLKKLLILFGPEIYAHSYVVGKAASALCGIIIEEEPAFFDDIDLIREKKDPREKKQILQDYAMQCGIFHDVGKLNFMNLYSHPGRQWFEEEYEMSHLHTVVGGNCLSTRPSTSLYAAAARGHHAWYDGSRGYPESYRRLECACRQMVDVIGLIDWMENVTFSNRLYTGVEKSFAEAVRTAIELEGRRFSPLLTVWLQEKRAAEQIEQAFVQGRREAYRKLYEEERAWRSDQ